jgi:uncharacterized protein YjiS (DUF1127 family)
MDRRVSASSGASATRAGIGVLVDRIGRLAALVSRWRERARGRRQLASLDARARNDLGLTRLDVARECAKPFWRA